MSATRTEPASATTRWERPYRLTVEQYEAMGRAGILHEKAPVYLWKGLLVEKMTKRQPHNIALGELSDRLKPIIPRGWYLGQEQPFRLGDDSMPEPDLMVVRGSRRDYPRQVPQSRDISLIVEVADSCLADDQGEALKAYATGSIPFYWIVNLRDRRIEVYSEPTSNPADPRYGKSESFAPSATVPVILDGREIGRLAVDDILP